MKKEVITDILCYVFLVIPTIIFIIMCLPNKTNNIEKVSYCRIDSVYTLSSNEFLPKSNTRYHTNCGFVFSSNKNYHIGDSVKIKTIIVQ